MKRTASLLLALIVCLVCSFSAYAEDFTIHSDVKFGMTIDEVVSLENSAGFSLEDGKLDYNNIVKLHSRKTLKGTVAGIEESEIDYAFDSEGKLYAATYALGKTGRSDLSGQYAEIDQRLISKYGTPDDSLLAVFFKVGYEPINFLGTVWFEIKDIEHLPQNSSWLIQQDDDHYIAISHMYFRGSILGDPFNMHLVGYQLFTAEELKTAMDELKNESDKANDDL